MTFNLRVVEKTKSTIFLPGQLQHVPVRENFLVIIHKTYFVQPWVLFNLTTVYILPII